MSSDIVKRLRIQADNIETMADAYLVQSLKEAAALIESQAARIEALEKALRSACGYMRNAQIDLDTGAPKKTALATITGGLKMVETALAATTPGEEPRT